MLPILVLTSATLVCRVPKSFFGKKFSVVSFGGCSFHCFYCLAGGYIPRDSIVFPHSHLVENDIIEGFIDTEVHKGNLIKLTGGEPTLFPDAVNHFIGLIKKLNGFVCLDTNGATPDIAIALARHVDLLSLDIKGTPRYLERLTGVSLNECWFNPIRTLEEVADLPCDIEVKTILFDFVSPDDILEIAERIPDRCFWTIKQFVPERIMPDQKWNYRQDVPSWLRPATESQILLIRDIILKQFPNLESRLTIITGNAREENGIIR